MIKLSKKVEYGLISLLHIAGLKADELVTTKELAGHYHIPQEVLGKVLQTLTKAELIESTQGVRGGYRCPGKLCATNPHRGKNRSPL